MFLPRYASVAKLRLQSAIHVSLHHSTFQRTNIQQPRDSLSFPSAHRCCVGQLIEPTTSPVNKLFSIFSLFFNFSGDLGEKLRFSHGLEPQIGRSESGKVKLQFLIPAMSSLFLRRLIYSTLCFWGRDSLRRARLRMTGCGRITIVTRTTAMPTT